MGGTSSPSDVGIVSTSVDDAPRSRIASAASMQIVARMLGTLASLVTVSLTTRALGPESYGHLQSALMFVTLWMSLTELGIGAVIVRRVTGLQKLSKEQAISQLRDLVRVNLGLSAVFGIPLTIAAFVCGALVYRQSPEVVTMIGIVSGMLLLNSLASSFDPVFMVSVRFKAVAMGDFAGRVAAMLATVVLVVTGAHLYLFAIVLLVPYALQLVFKAVAARGFGVVQPTFSLQASWDLVRESIPQTVIIVIAVLYWRIDGVILSTMSTAEQVGLYGLAYTLAFTASMVSELFLNTTLSTSTELFAKSRRQFVEFSRRNLEVLYLIALPLAVIGAMVAPELIELIGSSKFRGGGPVLAVLFIAAAVTFVNAAVSQALFAAHQQVFLMRLNVINLLINIALNVLLAPRFGAMGAATALLITELIGVVCTSIRLRALSLRTQPVSFVLWCIPALAVGASIAWLLDGVSVLIGGTAAAVAYVGANLFAGPARLPYLKSLLSGDSDHDNHPRTVAREAPHLDAMVGGYRQRRFVPFSEAETVQMPIVRVAQRMSDLEPTSPARELVSSRRQL